jgi:hypothetical protein
MRKMLQLESVKLIFIVTYDFLWFDESMECSKLLFSRISFIEMDCNKREMTTAFFWKRQKSMHYFQPYFQYKVMLD